MRALLPSLVCGSVLLSVGCTHMVENRVLQAFASSVKEHDLARMQAESSEEFEEKAVKGDETFRALGLE